MTEAHPLYWKWAVGKRGPGNDLNKAPSAFISYQKYLEKKVDEKQRQLDDCQRQKEDLRREVQRQKDLRFMGVR